MTDITFIPISALHGDNVVERSQNMPWYDGCSLLYELEHVHVASDRNLIDPRFPVQWVIRPMSDEHHDYRGYAGQVASGAFKPGDEVVVLPSGVKTRVAGIDTHDGAARGGLPAALGDHAPGGRRGRLARRHDLPARTTTRARPRSWRPWCAGCPSARCSRPGATGSSTPPARRSPRSTNLRYRFDVNTLHRDEEADGLGLNEIGRVHLRLSAPLLIDEYRRNRATGSFILIEESTNDTVGAGMILGVDD